VTFYFVCDTHSCSREIELSNVEIIVADISKFEMERSFDRIISIEMFEV
jgi:cyclopropane fatty-acyl-phospholipid synthase-like methyltransferase